MVPKFLTKTFEMVEDAGNADTVGWNAAGDVLVIKKLHEFTEQTLPKYFKHNNYASFVRQLNMYGFGRAKVAASQAFQHPLFLRGKLDNLALIKRKTSVPKSNLAQLATSQKGEIHDLIGKVKALTEQGQYFQQEITKLHAQNEDLKVENKLMWSAVGEARQKQEVLVDKMRNVLLYLYQSFMRPGISQKQLRDSIAEKLPQLMESAKDADLGLEIEELLDDAEAADASAGKGAGADANKGGPSSSLSSSSSAAGASAGGLSSASGPNDMYRLASFGPLKSIGGPELLEDSTKLGPVVDALETVFPASARVEGADGRAGEAGANNGAANCAPSTNSSSSSSSSSGAGAGTSADAGADAMGLETLPTFSLLPIDGGPGSGGSAAVRAAASAIPLERAESLGKQGSIQSFMELLRAEDELKQQLQRHGTPPQQQRDQPPADRADPQGGSSSSSSSFGKSFELAKGFSQYLNSQDDVFRKLSSVQSTLSDTDALRALSHEREEAETDVGTDGGRKKRAAPSSDVEKGEEASAAAGAADTDTASASPKRPKKEE